MAFQKHIFAPSFKQATKKLTTQFYNYINLSLT